MQWLVDKVACNKGTLLALRSLCVRFPFQVVWRMGWGAAVDSQFESEG